MAIETANICPAISSYDKLERAVDPDIIPLTMSSARLRFLQTTAQLSHTRGVGFFRYKGHDILRVFVTENSEQDSGIVNAFETFDTDIERLQLNPQTDLAIEEIGNSTFEEAVRGYCGEYEAPMDVDFNEIVEDDAPHIRITDAFASLSDNGALMEDPIFFEFPEDPVVGPRIIKRNLNTEVLTVSRQELLDSGEIMDPRTFNDVCLKYLQRVASLKAIRGLGVLEYRAVHGRATLNIISIFHDLSTISSEDAEKEAMASGELKKDLKKLGFGSVHGYGINLHDYTVEEVAEIHSVPPSETPEEIEQILSDRGPEVVDGKRVFYYSDEDIRTGNDGTSVLESVFFKLESSHEESLRLARERSLAEFEKNIPNLYLEIEVLSRSALSNEGIEYPTNLDDAHQYFVSDLAEIAYVKGLSVSVEQYMDGGTEMNSIVYDVFTDAPKLSFEESARLAEITHPLQAIARTDNPFRVSHVTFRYIPEDMTIEEIRQADIDQARRKALESAEIRWQMDNPEEELINPGLSGFFRWLLSDEREEGKRHYIAFEE